DLLNRPQLSEERRQRYTTAIADAVARAAKLTSQLLAFARRQTLKPEIFDVGERMQSLRDMLATLLGPAIEIVTQLPGEPCLVNADAGQLETAMINMATNARDAMQGKGRIVFTVHTATTVPETLSHVSGSETSKNPGFVCVAVSDAGVGIPAAQLGRIFE